MPTHIVVDGECMTSIAARYGFGDGKKIFDHEKNTDLKKKRPNGHQLYPGDLVFIPEPQKREISRAVGARHTIVVDAAKRLLRIKFLDGAGVPMKGKHYTLKGNRLDRSGNLDDSGVLEQSLPVHVTEAVVTIGELTRTVRIGRLHPLEQTADDGASGAQARLSNLGYAAGGANDGFGPLYRSAIEAFQIANGLKGTGTLDKATRQKLVEIHGC